MVREILSEPPRGADWLALTGGVFAYERVLRTGLATSKQPVGARLQHEQRTRTTHSVVQQERYLISLLSPSRLCIYYFQDLFEFTVVPRLANTFYQCR